MVKILKFSFNINFFKNLNKLHRIVLLIIASSLFHSNSLAQSFKGVNDTINVLGFVHNGDTLQWKTITNVVIRASAPEWLKAYWRNSKSNEAYLRTLKYNVNKVYPYAVAASFLLQDIDNVMGGLYSKDAKKSYKMRKEAELNARFKDELTNLTITQGQILVKLISRQTGKNVYTIIKQLKGGSSAFVSQAMAKLFDNNLRNEYDPNGADADIEGFVREIESKGSYKRIQ